MAGEQVLVIDDSKYMVSFLAETALPALGYQALVADTGRAGLELVESHHPDIILLDLNLPDMNGIDVVRNLAQAGNTTGVILMTAYGSERVAVDAFRLGVRDYLTKPVELDDLATALQRALQEPRLRRDKRQLAEELHRTNMELQRQVDQVAAFTNVGRAITASLELENILSHVMDAAVQLCQAEEATIWLLEGGHQELLMVAEKGMDHSAIHLPRLTRVRVQDALAGEAVRTGKPILRVAGRTGEAGIKVKTGYLVRSVMYVPVLIHDQCLGVVSVANRVAPRQFEQHDLVTLQALADYAAIAIENARLYRETDDALQKRLGELAAINEISESVATLDPRLLLSRAIRLMRQTFNVQAATLFLADIAQTFLIPTISSKTDTLDKPSGRIPFGKGIIGSCAQDGISYVANEPEAHPLFEPEVDQIWGRRVNSLLVVPLAVEERTIGAIALADKRAGPFDNQDATLLKTMATPVAVAVDNLRLVNQTVRERATLQAVLDGSANPILITSATGELLSCNSEAEQLFGASVRNAEGQSIGEATGLSLLDALIDQGARVMEEIEIDGHTYLASVSPIAQVGSVVQMQDITYLKELDQAKSDFFTSVSHDLRSPLTAVNGFIQLLPAAGELNEKQHEFVEQALESVDKMGSMITDLLDLAKLEAGLRPPDTPCDMYAIAERVVAHFQGTAINSEIALELFKRGRLPSVVGHEDQLQRALENLVSNALKYSPAGSHVRVGLQAVDHTLFVAVLDNGRGIPEKDIPHIFEKFYRVDEHSDQEGTGLGLALVKGVVEAHGGTISVRSQVGKGTTFTVALPAT